MEWLVFLDIFFKALHYSAPLKENILKKQFITEHTS